MEKAEDVMGSLGGKKVFGKVHKGNFDNSSEIEEGFPFLALRFIREFLKIDRSEASEYLLIPTRTLARRKKTGRFAPGESDRIYRMARLLAMAMTVLGSKEKAARWFTKSNRALGGRTPIEVSKTDAGAIEVVNILGRIDLGVYS